MTTGQQHRVAARLDWIGVVMVSLGGICFSTAVIFIRSTGDLDVMTPGFYRCLFAFLLYTIVIAAREREPLHLSAYRPAVPLLVVLGVAIAITTSLYTYAVQTTTAANATLLINTAPLYIALLSPLLLHEARPRLTWPSLGLAAAGIVLIIGPGNLMFSPEALAGGSEAMLGIGAAALSGVTYAMPLLIGRKLAGRVGGLTQSWWSMGIASVLLLPFAFRSSAAATVASLPPLIALGVISMGLAYLLVFNGLKRVKAQVASTAALFEPVGAMGIGLLFYGETLTLLGLLGSLLVLAAITLIARD